MKYRIIEQRGGSQPGFYIQRKILFFWSGASLDEWDICARVYNNYDEAKKEIDKLKSNKQLIKKIVYQE
jgi:hypothetical protein